jgi:endo-1,4-beta-xylanase
MKAAFRHRLAALMVLVTLGACSHPTPPATAAPAQPALKDAFAQTFLIGAALNTAQFEETDTAGAALVKRHFNTISPENVLKWESVHPQPGVYDFTRADRYVDFGTRNGMFIVGHTLVWHNQTPAWFFEDKDGRPNTSDAQIERLRAHIETVAGRYKGRVHAWDVVNEVIGEDGAYRPTSWVKTVGDGDTLVKAAFRFASQYAPDTELYYNDFNTWRPAKRDGIVRMVKMLKSEGIRIDGIGMQAHWGLNYPKAEYIGAAIDAYAALGVKVMITEMDVDVLPLTREGQIIGTAMSDPQFQLEEFKAYLDPYRNGVPPDVEQQIADRWAALFRILYERRDSIDRVTFWGAHDGLSWKNSYPIPGRMNYALLFGRDRQPKRAFDAVVAVPQLVGGKR